MAVRAGLSLVVLSAVISLVAGTGAEGVADAGKQCYSCGYRKMPGGVAEALPDTPYCSDFATPEDITANCTTDGDCCATLKEYFTIVDEETGENSTITVGRHGCESDLNHIGEQTVLCSEHTDECVNIDHASLPNHQDHNVTVTDIEICFCNGDRCNNDDPLPPLPTKEPTQPTPTTASGTKCYNCGHRTMPNGEMEALPDLPECNDFANPMDNVVTCSVDGDCCAALKEYFTIVDEDTGENSTITVGRHGCESDLNKIGQETVLCSEHTDQCVQIEQSSLPDHTDHNVTITDAEICFCSGDRCNNDDPIPPKPTDPASSTTTTGKPETTTGSGASSLVTSFVSILFAMAVSN